MRITGENTIGAPVEQVWDALLDPRVLVATIPGCEQLETTGEHSYAMTVTAGVAAIKGTYTGSCQLADLQPHDSLAMRLQGAGAPGTIDATVAVRFSGEGDRTLLSYDADAVVGGMVGGVGQRMLTSVSRRMAAEFFGNVEAALTEGLPVAPAVAVGPETSGATVFTAPPSREPALAGDRAFLLGMALGGALALGGVVLGGILGRRR
jgi:carbon monoxide dehydrogenase subunit G